MNKTILLRADDLGSSHSANNAIVRALKNKLIRNVSIMAVGPALDEAAELLANNEDVCFGMHATLNAEWDKVKWKPLTQLSQESGLVDENGYFLNNPELFINSKPKIEDILKEFDLQLDLLIKKGFKIKYVDSHMFPETKIDGLDEAMKQWIKDKRLIDHAYYYGNLTEIRVTDIFTLYKTIRNLKNGQHFMVVHPSLDTKEMRMTGNNTYAGTLVAKMRDKETKVMSNIFLPMLFKILNVKTVRYDQATPGERIDFKKF